MADIVSIREFTQRLKTYSPGEEVIIVNAVKKRIVASIQFKQPPEAIEQTITKVFRK